MIPKSWPKRLIYARESVSVEIAHSILQHCLRSKAEDADRISRVIEEKSVHPHLQIKKITSSLKIDGLQVHPLANKKTLRGHSHYGIFSTERIPSGTELGEYVGEISLVNPKDFIRTVSNTTQFSEYKWVVSANNLYFEIDAQKIANECALINDYRGLRCGPNVKMAPIVHRGFIYFGYVASRDIAKGEEILADYGEAFYKAMINNLAQKTFR